MYQTKLHSTKTKKEKAISNVAMCHTVCSILHTLSIGHRGLSPGQPSLQQRKSLPLLTGLAQEMIHLTRQQFSSTFLESLWFLGNCNRSSLRWLVLAGVDMVKLRLFKYTQCYYKEKVLLYLVLPFFTEPRR